MAGKIQTVLGEIKPENAGVSLMHEHLLWDLTFYYEIPPQAPRRKLGREKVCITNLGDVRLNPFAIEDNLLMDDVGLAIEEAKRFRWAGGGTIVDVTCAGMGGDVEALRKIAIETGLNIVTGCGYYIAPSHPKSIQDKSVEEICDEIIEEIENGIENTGIKPGVIGEIGTSQILTKNEEKALRAAGRAQINTGLPLYVHPYFRDRKPHALKHLDILEEEGVALNRVIICHMDGDLNLDYHRKIAKRGAYVAYDTFGKEYTRTELDYELPKDTKRVKFLVDMIDQGFGEQMLISHDTCYKMDLRRYGKWGYDHIPVNVVPMLKKAGLENETIHQLLVINPKNALTIEC